MQIPFEKHTLPNGLDVIIHEDHADPVVSVYLYYHVGSSREVSGKSGFAHLFEHLLFEGSENVHEGDHFRLIQEAGGTLNGSTSHDRTNYYESLPSNHLELALWLEADRMGFLLPGVTQQTLDNQKAVVKNERRQSYENQPYGLVSETVARHLHHRNHPYAWNPIGSMADIDAATLEDVHGFFKRWYGPNNATLAIGGDVDPAKTLALVERYFGPIPRGPEVLNPEPEHPGLFHSRRLQIEDSVQVPQLSLVWPTVEMWHPDEPAITILAEVLSANKSAVLDKALTVDEELATYITISHNALERAGSLWINVRPHDGVTLDRLEARILELIHQVVRDGITDEHVERLLNRRAGFFLRALDTIANRTNILAHYNCYRGDPGLVEADLARHAAVTREDIVRACERYLDGRPNVALSVVPTGKPELAASGCVKESALPPLTLDRTQQPISGPIPAVTVPVFESGALKNGVRVLTAGWDRIPTSAFQVSAPFGRYREKPHELGVANLTAMLLEEGTEHLDSIALQDEIDGLGAIIEADVGEHEFTWFLSTLDQHLPRAVELLQDVILKPRFAQADFDRCQRQRLMELQMRTHHARALAGDAFSAVMFGPGTIAGTCPYGTTETIARLTLDDVRRFYHEGLAVKGMGVIAVSGHARDTLLTGMDRLSALTLTHDGPPPPDDARGPAMPGIFLVHREGPQSEIRIGHPSISALHEDFYGLHASLYPLGGSFTSRINLNLREDKGYTYGAQASLSANGLRGSFVAATAVHTEVTDKAVAEVLLEIERYLDGPTPVEVDFTRRSLMQSMVRHYEAQNSRVGFAANLLRYEWAPDYPNRRLAWLSDMTAEAMGALVRRHLRPDQLAVVVVGDRALVSDGLAALGRGPVQEIDATGAYVGA